MTESLWVHFPVVSRQHELATGVLDLWFCMLGFYHDGEGFEVPLDQVVLKIQLECARIVLGVLTLGDIALATGRRGLLRLECSHQEERGAEGLPLNLALILP